MRLYHGGFRGVTTFVVAENEQDAIAKIGTKLNMAYLPVEVEAIGDIDGYKIALIDPGEQPKQEVEPRPKKPPSWRKR